MTHFSFEGILTAICLSLFYEDKDYVCLISYPWPLTLCLACSLNSVNISNERINRINFVDGDTKKGKDTFVKS